MTTGRLLDIGIKNLGRNQYRYVQCVDCGDQYPHIDGVPKCNGQIIGLCPWCRPDSQPWQKGRGI